MKAAFIKCRANVKYGLKIFLGQKCAREKTVPGEKCAEVKSVRVKSVPGPGSKVCQAFPVKSVCQMKGKENSQPFPTEKINLQFHMIFLCSQLDSTLHVEWLF